MVSELFICKYISKLKDWAGSPVYQLVLYVCTGLTQSLS